MQGARVGLPHLAIRETRRVHGWGYHTLRLGGAWGSQLGLPHLAIMDTCLASMDNTSDPFLRMSHAKLLFFENLSPKSLKTIMFLIALCKHVAIPFCFWTLTSRSA